MNWKPFPPHLNSLSCVLLKLSWCSIRVMYPGSLLLSDQSTITGIFRWLQYECFVSPIFCLKKATYFRKFKVLPVSISNQLFTKQKEDKIWRWSREGKLLCKIRNIWWKYQFVVFVSRKITQSSVKLILFQLVSLKARSYIFCQLFATAGQIFCNDVRK